MKNPIDSKSPRRTNYAEPGSSSKKYPDDLKQKNRTAPVIKEEKLRNQSQPKEQREESESIVNSELNGKIENSQANASDWKPE